MWYGPRVRYLLPLFLVFLASCQSCGPGTPIQIAQRLVPDDGFHVLAAAGGELQAYPPALYYSGQGHASVTWAHRGRALHTLEFAPGASQFRLIAVDEDKIRLLDATCQETHARGHFTWIECEDSDAKSPPRGTRVLLEFDPATGAVTKPGGCGTCPRDSSGTCCCPDTPTGYECPSAR